MDYDQLLNHLSFLHFIELLKVETALKRVFYEVQTPKNNWSVRDLQRAMKSALYERTGLCRNKKKLLHYQALDAALTRRELYKILEDKWNLNSFSTEAKKVDFCVDHYKRHQEGNNGASQKHAIRRARTLHTAYHGQQNFAEQIPCTTVYLLVEELNKNIK